MQYQLDLGVEDHKHLNEFVEKSLSLRPKERRLKLDRQLTIVVPGAGPDRNGVVTDLKFVLPKGKELGFFPIGGKRDNNANLVTNSSKFIVIHEREQLMFTRKDGDLRLKVTDLLNRPIPVEARQFSMTGVGL